MSRSHSDTMLFVRFTVRRLKGKFQARLGKQREQSTNLISHHSCASRRCWHFTLLSV